MVEFLCSIALNNHFAELNASETNFLSFSFFFMSPFTFSAKPSSILIAGKVDLLSSTFQPFLVFSITTSGGSILKSSSEKEIAGFGFKLLIVFIYSDSFSSLTFASLQSF